MFRTMRFYLRCFSENQLPLRAAALTYVFILSIVPAIGVCLYLVSLFLNMQEIHEEIKSFLISNLATGPSESLRTYIEGFLTNTGIRQMGILGVGTLFVTSYFLIVAIEDAVNHVWQIPISQKIGQRLMGYLLLLVFGPVTIAFSLSVTTVIAPFLPQFFAVAKVASVVTASLLFTCIFMVLPNTKTKLKYALVAGLFVALASNLAKWGFSLYTTQTDFYKTIYGSLAVLPLFLVWIYLNWLIFLAGCQLMVVLQFRRNLAYYATRRQWQTGPMFQKVRFELVRQILELMHENEMTRKMLVRQFGVSAYKVDSALEWMLRQGIMKFRRKGLRRIYSLTDAAEKFNEQDLWQQALDCDVMVEKRKDK